MALRVGFPPTAVPPSVHRHLWLVAVLFYGVGDVTTTVVGMRADGLREAGPITALLVQQHGLPGLVLGKVAVVAGAVLLWKFLPHPQRVGIPVGLAVVGVSATGWNAALLVVVVLL